MNARSFHLFAPIALACGCHAFGYQGLSAKQVDCRANEIEVSHVTRAGSATTWNASCRGRTYLCGGDAEGNVVCKDQASAVAVLPPIVHAPSPPPAPAATCKRSDVHAWTLLLVTHVAAALVSVSLGVVQLVRRKGDARHRLLGRVWVGLMLWTAVSSFWIRHLRDGAVSWLHILSLVTLVTVTLGVVAIRRGDVRAHRGNMIGSWLGSAIAMVFAVAIPTRMIAPEPGRG